MQTDHDLSARQLKELDKLAISIQDPDECRQKLRDYGFDEIVSQYANLFSNLNQRRPASFEDLFALYQLDQRCKNILMVSLQLFEQSFKTALVRALDQLDQDQEIFAAAYQLDDGRVIRRGDLKARIRHLRRNYVEPYAGYRGAHHGHITNWVLVKEMSFGVATNAFFLLNAGSQREILAKLYRQTVTLTDFEEILHRARTFRGRAAHNYRLLGQQVGQQYLYQVVLADLALLANPDPYHLANARLKKVLQAYCQRHPQQKRFINDNFSNRH